jgi:hypothetical protein
MFPTSHDLLPEYERESIATIRNLLDNGNKVLIVTKPHASVIKSICTSFGAAKGDLLFRFTITALNPELSSFWELEAPAPRERIRSLKYAFEHGYSTSVSCEPFLCSVDETCELVDSVSPHVTDTIWIGKASRIPRKLNSHIPGFAAALDALQSHQTDEEILRLVKRLSKNKTMKWKDSVQDVLDRSSSRA